VGLVDQGVQLGLGVGGLAGVDALGQHPAGGHHLDAAGPQGEVGPHGRPHGVGPVGDPPQVGDVAAGHGHRRARGHDPRPGDRARLHGPADQHRLGPGGAEVADQGDAVLQLAAGVGHRGQGPLGLGPGDVGGQVGAAAGHQVDVGVDQPGQQGGSGEVERRRAPGGLGEAGGRAGVGDPATLDEHGGVGDRPGTGAVEQLRGAQHDGGWGLGAGHVECGRRGT
jgi:hypothetical protein